MACSPSKVSRQRYSCIQSEGSTKESRRAGWVHAGPAAPLPPTPSKNLFQGPLTSCELFLHSQS